MKKTLLWKALCLLMLFTNGILTSCSDDTEEQENILEGWYEYVYYGANGKQYWDYFIIDVITADGIDLMNPETEGTVNTEELAILINGKDCPIERENPEAIANVTVAYIYDGDDELPREEQRRWKLRIVNMSSLNLQVDTPYEIVFNWGKTLGKDVLKFQFTMIEDKMYEQLLLNGKSIKRYDGESMAFVK